MSECPYQNFKSKVSKFINLLRIPREEYGGLPPCPFVGAEVDKDRLLIDVFDPSKSTIIEMVEKLNASNYDSALFVQVTQEELSCDTTIAYQSFLNGLLKDEGYGNLKCICINPNDTFETDGFNIRSRSPYFLINVAERSALSSTHKKMLKTKYFDKMSNEYLDYLKVKKQLTGEKNEKRRNRSISKSQTENFRKI